MPTIRILLAACAVGSFALSGCSQPAVPGSDATVGSEPAELEPASRAASRDRTVDSDEAVAELAGLPAAPAELVAFDAAAQPLAAVEVEPALLPSEPRDALFRKRVAAFAAEARAAVAILEGRGNTDGFDRHCGRMKNLLVDARLADEDDQFVTTLGHADLILQQLHLARLLLGQRDELAQARTPAQLKLLRDTELECSRAARELQGQIARAAPRGRGQVKRLAGPFLAILLCAR